MFGSFGISASRVEEASPSLRFVYLLEIFTAWALIEATIWHYGKTQFRLFWISFAFIVASTIAHRHDGKVGPDSELVELVWLPIAEAKRHDLPTITQVALDELEARVAKGFGHELPSPFCRMLHRKFVRAEL